MQENSFRNRVLPLKDKLFRLALRITLNQEEAEDIVQDAMVRVWEKREEWSNIDSIEAYCMTIVKNLAIDKNDKMESKNQSLTPEMEGIEETMGPYKQLEESERLQLIHRLINQLPERERVIIQLRDIEGKNYKEIASILQLTDDQVKINLFRARQKIKEKFLAIDKYGL